MPVPTQLPKIERYGTAVTAASYIGGMALAADEGVIGCLAGAMIDP
jgi:hypothetical protein